MQKVKRLLIVSAHPDDEVLGCGGTIARLVAEGYAAYTLILGEGTTSRDNIRNREKRKKQIMELKRQAEEANKILGVREVFFLDFPDNRFDTVSLLDIVKGVEQVKNDIKPDIVFTHSDKDLNIDHQIAYKAVIIATRPLKGETVKEIYSFEILSSTEWSYPLGFLPNIFFDVSETIDIKLKAVEKYKTELREFPHPRSLEGIRLNAEYWGMRLGVKYAEALKCVRVIR